MKFMFEILSEHLVYLNRFVPKIDTKPYLAGVLFNLKDNEAVATDGCRLMLGKNCLVCYDEEKPDMIFISFPKDIISDIRKEKENYIQIKVESNNNEDFYASVDWSGAYFHNRTVYVGDSSMYPNYKMVVNDSKPCNSLEEITVSPKLLKDFPYRNGEGAKMIFGENDQSAIKIKINSKGFENFDGLLMPMRF